MIHSEAKYVQMGCKFEKAATPTQAQAIAETIRSMIEAEDIEDRAEARYLVERGRKEARQYH